MAGMATGAGSTTSIRVDSSNAHAGPCFRRQHAILKFNDCSVAMITTGCPFIITVHALVEPGIDLPDDLQGIGVFAETVLFELLLNS